MLDLFLNLSHLTLIVSMCKCIMRCWLVGCHFVDIAWKVSDVYCTTTGMIREALISSWATPTNVIKRITNACVRERCSKRWWRHTRNKMDRKLITSRHEKAENVTDRCTVNLRRKEPAWLFYNTFWGVSQLRSSFFYVLVLFLSGLVIGHVRQAKLARSLVNFLTYANILIDWLRRWKSSRIGRSYEEFKR